MLHSQQHNAGNGHSGPKVGALSRRIQCLWVSVSTLLHHHFSAAEQDSTASFLFLLSLTNSKARRVSPGSNVPAMSALKHHVELGRPAVDKGWDKSSKVIKKDFTLWRVFPDTGYGAAEQAHPTLQQDLLQAWGEQLNARDKRAGRQAAPAAAFHPQLLTFPAPQLLFISGNACPMLMGGTDWEHFMHFPGLEPELSLKLGNEHGAQEGQDTLWSCVFNREKAALGLATSSSSSYSVWQGSHRMEKGPGHWRLGPVRLLISWEIRRRHMGPSGHASSHQLERAAVGFPTCRQTSPP